MSVQNLTDYAEVEQQLRATACLDCFGESPADLIESALRRADAQCATQHSISRPAVVLSLAAAGLCLATLSYRHLGVETSAAPLATAGMPEVTISAPDTPLSTHSPQPRIPDRGDRNVMIAREPAASNARFTQAAFHPSGETGAGAPEWRDSTVITSEEGIVVPVRVDDGDAADSGVVVVPVSRGAAYTEYENGSEP